MSKNLKTKDRFVFSRTITCEDVVGICQLMGLDPCSPDSRTLRPFLQSFATGPAWTALANLAGFNAIPVSSALEYAAPVEIGDTITAIAEAEERTREGSLKVRLFFQNHRGHSSSVFVPPTRKISLTNGTDPYKPLEFLSFECDVVSELGNMLERSLSSSRYLVVITIAVCMIAAVSLYVIAAMAVFSVVVDTVRAGPWLPGVSKDAVVGFLDAIDKLLVAIGMQIIAIGAYKIFLGGDLDTPAGLQVSSFGELKRSVVKLIGVVLLVLFLEQAVKYGPSEDILYFGLAIAAVIAAFGWAISVAPEEEK